MVNVRSQAPALVARVGCIRDGAGSQQLALGDLSCVVQLEGPTHETGKDHRSLAVRVYGKDTEACGEAVVGLAQLPASEYTRHIDRGTRLLCPLQVDPDRWPGASPQSPPLISLRLYSPQLGRTVAALDAVRGGMVAFAGGLTSLAALLPVWEAFMADLFPCEAHRPAVAWRARANGAAGGAAWSSAASAASPLFPQQLGAAHHPTHDGTEVLLLIRDWAVEVAARHGDGAAVLLLAGTNQLISAGEMRYRIDLLLRHRVTPGELAAAWALEPATHQYGVLAAGPQAGAVFITGLHRRLRLLRNTEPAVARSPPAAAPCGELVGLCDPRCGPVTGDPEELRRSPAVSRLFDFAAAPSLRRVAVVSATLQLAVPPRAGLFNIYDAVADELRQVCPGGEVAVIAAAAAVRGAEDGFVRSFAARGVRSAPPAAAAQALADVAVAKLRAPVDGAASLLQAREGLLDSVAAHAAAGAVAVALCCADAAGVVSPRLVSDDARTKGVRTVCCVAALADQVAVAFSAEPAVAKVVRECWRRESDEEVEKCP